MKTVIKTLLSFALLVMSCKENGKKPVAEQAVHTEESLVQEPKILNSEKNGALSLTYFALDEQVAVKLKKENAPERTLLPSGTNTSGNPVFTDGETLWEMLPDGQSGIYTDENGMAETYR